MDTPSILPKGSTPRLQCAPGIELTQAQEELLKQAFQNNVKMNIEKKFQGYSGASIYLVTCDSQAPVIIKMAHPYHIRREYAAYQNFVRHNMTLIVARIEDEPVISEERQLGLLLYTFIGADPEKPASSLADYYYQQGGKATAEVINLIFDYGKRWWLYHQPKRIFPYEEYDLLLPADVQLNVCTEPLPEAHVLQAQEIKLPELRKLQPGQPVRVEGFQVSKVRPNALTLSIPAPPGHHPTPPHLRLQGKMDKEYQPGDELPAQFAVVEATQFMLLTAYATESLPELDPTQAYFSVEGQKYRNPLSALTDLLDRPYDTNFSIIHSDLNLQNIMVAAHLEYNARFAWLIDFAETRQGPTLLDLQRLEVQIITKLLPVSIKPAQLVMLLEALHQKSPPASLSIPILREPYFVLFVLRRLAQKCLIDSDEWGEYYRGLAIVLLGALKFEELNREARKRAIIAAATVLEFVESPKSGSSKATNWRKWGRNIVVGILLLVVIALPSTLLKKLVEPPTGIVSSSQATQPATTMPVAPAQLALLSDTSISTTALLTPFDDNSNCTRLLSGANVIAQNGRYIACAYPWLVFDEQGVSASLTLVCGTANTRVNCNFEVKELQLWQNDNLALHNYGHFTQVESYTFSTAQWCEDLQNHQWEVQAKGIAIRFPNGNLSSDHSVSSEKTIRPGCLVPRNPNAKISATPMTSCYGGSVVISDTVPVESILSSAKFTTSSRCRDINIKFVELPEATEIRAVQCPNAGDWQGEWFAVDPGNTDWLVIASSLRDGTCFQLELRSPANHSYPILGYVAY